MSGLALPLLPLGGALLLAVLQGRSRLLGPLAVAALLGALALGVWSAAEQPEYNWHWSPAIYLGLSVAGFGRVMVVLVPLIAAPIVAYAAATEEEATSRLSALMLAFVGAMLLLVIAADFLTLLIAWELVGATSWALIAHEWRDPGNVQSACQAFITTRFGDLGLYLAAGLLFASTGSFAFSKLGEVDGLSRDAIAAGVLLAAAAKSAQVPFSPWLFSAMAGPTPVSALLHSATLVAAGAYILIRLSPDLAPVGWFLPSIAGIGLATALAGGTVAALQTHAKRVLAGSTSAQYGLMFIAIGASSTAAAGAQLVAHALFKSLLFLAVGIAVHTAGSMDMSGFRLGRQLPLVAALSAVGAFALAAVPPLGAAWTKEQVLAAAADSSIWLAIGTLAAGYLSAFYAARFQILVWAPSQAAEGGGRQGPHVRRQPSATEVASVAALALFTALLTALWLPRARDLVEEASGGRLFEGAAWELPVSLVLIIVAFALVWRLFQSQTLIGLGLPRQVQAAASDWLGLPIVARLLVVDPVLAFSGFLARFDSRVIDAGIRLVAAIASSFSRLFSWRGEWTIDGAVQAVARATMVSADRSRLADEAAVDGAVEGGARGVGAAGELSRKLQTGLSHHYYVLLVVGLVAVAAILGVTI